MRELTLKEENIIDVLWTAVEQWDACDGTNEGSANECEKCPFAIFHYEPRYGVESYQCLKILIEQVHEEACT
jgi:hypothetical protein